MLTDAEEKQLELLLDNKFVSVRKLIRSELRKMLGSLLQTMKRVEGKLDNISDKLDHQDEKVTELLMLLEIHHAKIRVIEEYLLEDDASDIYS